MTVLLILDTHGRHEVLSNVFQQFFHVIAKALSKLQSEVQD